MVFEVTSGILLPIRGAGDHGVNLRCKTVKRYRTLPFFDFDTRANTLSVPIRDEWEDDVKKQYSENRKKVIESLIHEFGEQDKDKKLENFLALHAKPFSIVAFHNRFFNQVRRSFVIAAYYPALTGACALGERILNHLVLLLRNDYKSTSEYKKVYRKESFDDWMIPITALKAWNVLLPDVEQSFLKLKKMRNKAIHFQPETDRNDRALALEAVNCLSDIIGSQFSGFGPKPWFITDVLGEVYVKQGWETKPFIRKVYLPNCVLVGPKHRIESLYPQVIINDSFQYEQRVVCDDEFCQLRNENLGRG